MLKKTCFWKELKQCEFSAGVSCIVFRPNKPPTLLLKFCILTYIFLKYAKFESHLKIVYFCLKHCESKQVFPHSAEIHRAASLPVQGGFHGQRVL